MTRPNLPQRTSIVLRPLPAALATLAALALLVGVDALRHGGAPAFPGAWLALIAWPLAVGSLVGLGAALRERPARLLLLLTAGALVAGTLELLLPRLFPERGLPRLRGVRSQHLHHALAAGSTMFAGLYDPEDRPVVVQTNRDGLRSSYERADFLAAPRRIAVLGDSFVFGWGVQGDAAWPARLEAALRDRTEQPVAVLNAGVFSYSPLLSRRQWQRTVAAYEPDLVLLVLDATDIGDDWKYRHEITAEGDFPWPDQPSLPWRGALFELVRPLVDQLRPVLLYPARVLRHAAGSGADYYDFRLAIGGVTETNRFFIYRHPLEATRPYFESAWAEVSALGEEVQASGARFAVVILPRFHHWNPSEAPGNWEHDQYRLDEPFADAMFAFYRERAASAPFPVLDLLPQFRATDRFPLVFAQDPHFNEAGNQFVADLLAEPVTELLADATDANHQPP